MFKTIVFGLLLFSIFAPIVVFADKEADKGGKGIKGSYTPTTFEEVKIVEPPIEEEKKCETTWEKTKPNQSMSDRFTSMGLFLPTCVGVMIPIGGGVMGSEILDGTSGRFMCKKEKGAVNEKE